MSKERAAKIANSPNSSSKGGKKSGSGSAPSRVDHGPEEGRRPQGRKSRRSHQGRSSPMRKYSSRTASPPLRRRVCRTPTPSSRERSGRSGRSRPKTNVERLTTGLLHLGDAPVVGTERAVGHRHVGHAGVAGAQLSRRGPLPWRARRPRRHRRRVGEASVRSSVLLLADLDRPAQVGDQAGVLLVTIGRLLGPQHGRRMDRGDDRPAVEVEDLAPGGADPELAAEERLTGRRPRTTMTAGSTVASSLSSHGLQAAISRAEGR